jgi:HemK-like putative methylase
MEGETEKRVNPEYYEAIVGINSENVKLFTFCRKAFKKISKRFLRQCFVDGAVRVNGIRIAVRGDHTNECKRTKAGDVVRLYVSVEKKEREKLSSISINPILVGDGFIFLEKPSGLSSAQGKTFEAAINAYLGDGPTYFPYRLDKCMYGILMIFTDPEVSRRMLSRATLAYRCIVVGKLDDSANVIVVPATETAPEERIQVLSLGVSRCRKVGYISHIELLINMTERGTSSIVYDKAFAKDLSQHIKYIRRKLSRAGHSIVGDNGLVKSGKGIYAAITAVTIENQREQLASESGDIQSPETTDDCESSVTYKVEEPSKFVKLMVREQAMWEAQKVRDEKILQDLKSNVPWHFGDETDEDGSEFMAEDELSDSETKADLGWGAEEVEMPVEYRAQQAIFLGRSFFVNEHVMIPRKSSETLVLEAVNYIMSKESSFLNVDDALTDVTKPTIRVLDLGTGSGCLLLSCLKELQSAGFCMVEGVGIDISALALQVAHRNSLKMGLQDCTHFVEMGFENISDFEEWNFDIVLCNPPYSSEREKSRLSARYRIHEPSIALFSPGDPLSLYRVISSSLFAIRDCNISVMSDSRLFLEVGNGQEKSVRKIFDTHLDGSESSHYVCSCIDRNNLVRCLVFHLSLV